MKESWKNNGFVDEPVPVGIDIKSEIRRMCEEKNAVILAHYYTSGDIQDVADFVGDSLALAQQAAKTTADVIVMCGVHFMAETNKVLCPDKKVLLPDLNAGCSLADTCKAEDLAEYKKQHPEKILFAPDKNLGGYLNAVTGRNMLLWNGGCHVHERFSIEKIIELKAQYPDAKVLAHPECKSAVLALADYVGSTAAILKYAQTDDSSIYLVVTESGILHEMQKSIPGKQFIPVPPEVVMGDACACNECNYMRMNTMEKLYNCLKYEWPEVSLDETMREDALRPIVRMLEISEQLK